MTRSLMTASLLCVGVLLLAPASAQPAAMNTAPQETPCLRQGFIYDYQLVPGNRSLVVIDRARKRFRLNFMSTCRDIQHEFGLRFKTFGAGSLSCVGKGDSVLLRDPVGPGRCIIREIQFQTPALDHADLEAAQAAKQR